MHGTLQLISPSMTSAVFLCITHGILDTDVRQLAYTESTSSLRKPVSDIPSCHQSFKFPSALSHCLLVTGKTPARKNYIVLFISQGFSYITNTATKLRGSYAQKMAIKRRRR